MASIYSKGISVSIFGESHGDYIGVTLDSLPVGQQIDLKLLQKFVSKRSSSIADGLTKRNETDSFEIISGLLNGKTTGAPLSAIIKNNDIHSPDYETTKNLARPSHVDYPAYIKYKGFADYRGGGHLSGRLTAPLVVAGGICSQILNAKDIFCFSHISSIGEINDTPFDYISPDISCLKEFMNKKFLTLDDKSGTNMQHLIRKAKENSDSIGGSVETIVTGLAPGVGAPIFDGLESEISHLIFSIPAVKAIEFGAGVNVAEMYGSQNNDEFYIQDAEVKTKTNNHGGILGGISSGMPIYFKTFIKPTPSISQLQQTIRLDNKEEDEIYICGRHDACIVPRALPAVLSATCIAVLSSLIDSSMF